MLCGLQRGGVSFGRVLRLRRGAAGWGAFTFGFVGVRGRKATRPPPPPPPTQKGGEEEKDFGGILKLPSVFCGVLKELWVPMGFLLGWSCGYTAALGRLERMTGIEEEIDFGKWCLEKKGAPPILVKFNVYDCNLWPLRALEIYKCKIFLHRHAVDTPR